MPRKFNFLSDWVLFVSVLGGATYSGRRVGGGGGELS